MEDAGGGHEDAGADDGADDEGHSVGQRDLPLQLDLLVVHLHGRLRLHVRRAAGRHRGLPGCSRVGRGKAGCSRVRREKAGCGRAGRSLPGPRVSRPRRASNRCRGSWRERAIARIPWEINNYHTILCFYSRQSCGHTFMDLRLSEK